MDKIKDIKLKQLKSNTWEYNTSKYNYDIIKCDGVYIITLYDIFRVGVKYNFIKSNVFNLQQTLQDVKKYILDIENNGL